MVIKMFIIYFLGITMGLILSILKDKLFNLIIKRNKYLKQKQYKVIEILNKNGKDIKEVLNEAFLGYLNEQVALQTEGLTLK